MKDIIPLFEMIVAKIGHFGSENTGLVVAEYFGEELKCLGHLGLCRCIAFRIASHGKDWLEKWFPGGSDWDSK